MLRMNQKTQEKFLNIIMFTTKLAIGACLIVGFRYDLVGVLLMKIVYIPPSLPTQSTITLWQVFNNCFTYFHHIDTYERKEKGVLMWDK